MIDDAFDGLFSWGDDSLDFDHHHWSVDQVFSPWHHDGSVLSASDDAAFWQKQTTPFTCAVVCQQMILRQFGVEVSEAQLVYDATSHGWLTDRGMNPADMGRLLEYYGVPMHQCSGDGIEAIASEIAMGHKVIVAVDSGELWKQDWFFEDWIDPNAPDHAVVVTGLDLSDPKQPKVYLNDPGDPTGAGKAYPLEDFLEAWADSRYYYVATDHAPMDLATHSVFGSHFNQETGLYRDADFWLQWLQEVVSEFDADFFKSLLKAAVATATVVATSYLLDMAPAWDTLDDAARNELFLSIV
ncbi:MAG: C39 family peptidase [Thermoguttaceae bacterium]|nr:C39 family peptidase [Thermoguttaceae bacterium]